jgi:hypothetical protein
VGSEKAPTRGGTRPPFTSGHCIGGPFPCRHPGRIPHADRANARTSRNRILPTSAAPNVPSLDPSPPSTQQPDRFSLTSRGFPRKRFVGWIVGTERHRGRPPGILRVSGGCPPHQQLRGLFPVRPWHPAMVYIAGIGVTPAKENVHADDIFHIAGQTAGASWRTTFRRILRKVQEP